VVALARKISNGSQRDLPPSYSKVSRVTRKILITEPELEGGIKEGQLTPCISEREFFFLRIKVLKSCKTNFHKNLTIKMH
jgi:hypothetical protein